MQAVSSISKSVTLGNPAARSNPGGLRRSLASIVPLRRISENPIARRGWTKIHQRRAVPRTTTASRVRQSERPESQTSRVRHPLGQGAVSGDWDIHCESVIKRQVPVAHWGDVATATSQRVPSFETSSTFLVLGTRLWRGACEQIHRVPEPRIPMRPSTCPSTSAAGATKRLGSNSAGEHGCEREICVGKSD